MMITAKEFDVIVAKALDLKEGPYSQDIAATWKVLAAMYQRGFSFRLDVDWDGTTEARFWSPEPGMNAKPYCGKVDFFLDAPNAICNAAIRAMEGLDK